MTQTPHSLRRVQELHSGERDDYAQIFEKRDSELLE